MIRVRSFFGSCLTVILLVSAGCAEMEENDQRAEQFLAGITNLNFEAARGLMCPEYQEAHDVASFERSVRAVPYLRQVQNIETYSTSIWRGMSTVEVLYECPYGTMMLTVNSRQNGDGWCIVSADVMGLPIVTYGSANQGAPSVQENPPANTR